MKNWILGLVALLVVSGLVVANMKREAGKTMAVSVEKIARRPLVSRVTASGRIQPKREVKVSATRMGRITRLGVAEGDRVKTGDFLIEIDPSPYSSAVERLRANVDAARANQGVAAAEEASALLERDRVAGLRAAGLASERDTERALTAYSVASARLAAAREQVREAEAMLGNARHELSEVTIRAEMDGVITHLNVEVGETAVVGTMNVPGTELLRVADLSVMEAEVKVDETDLVDVALGQPAEVTIDSYPDTTFRGSVTEIGNSPLLASTTGRDQSVDFKVVVTLSDSVPGVRPGLSAKAEITVAERDSAITVPIPALTVRRAEDLVERRDRRRRSGESAAADTSMDAAAGRKEIEGVFVVEGGRARYRPVTAGISGEDYFEVLSGLEPGETVVSGDFKAVRELENGQKIRVLSKEGRKETRR